MAMTAAMKVLVVDDHEVVRQGIKMVLETDPELEVVGEAASGEDAIGFASCARTSS
jgi:DNA-binding NarL/FixJ family response regulator